MSIRVATFYGAHDEVQLRRATRAGQHILLGMAAISSLIFLLLGKTLVQSFTTDPAVIQLGARIMLWTVPFNAVFMPVEVFAGAMRGTGYSVMPTVITCLCICVFRVVWIFTIVSRWHRIELLAVCYPVSWALAAVVFLITYLRGNWLHRRIAECGMEPEVR